MQNTNATSDHQTKIMKTIAKRSFCTLATTSPAGRPHSAGVIYQWADDSLWIHTLRTSHKAHNVANCNRAGICIPFRRLPVGPPFTIHFQAEAELVDMTAPQVRTLIDAGSLDDITGHGELDMPDGCFMRITPIGTVHSFGPGARLIDLIRDPLTSGARSFRIDRDLAMTS